jgi:hypothetical protein
LAATFATMLSANYETSEKGCRMKKKDKIIKELQALYITAVKMKASNDFKLGIANSIAVVKESK